MPYYKHQRKVDGNFGRKEMKCFNCGTVIEFGEFYYSKITKRFKNNAVKHLCEKCYEKQFITA
jgi:mannitol-1-phosphate/altronate dehydrogenase